MINIKSCYRDLGFSESPFNLTPDTAFFFPAKQHLAALDHLRYGLLSNGFTMLTGEVGLGKTLLCRQLLRSAGDSIKTVYIYNTQVNILDLMKLIYHDLTGMHAGKVSHGRLFHEINKILLQLAEKDQKVVVLIDEAQRLDAEVLEGLRLLSNLETEKEKLLSFIMVGQPELADLLASEFMRPLAQRINVKFHLRPFGYRDTRNYIIHRLKAAAVKLGSPLFSEFAIMSVYWWSKGVPRRINQICDRALLASFVAGERRVGSNFISRAAVEVIG